VAGGARRPGVRGAGPGDRLSAVAGVAAFAAWAGAAVIVLSDGRRGLAVGLGPVVIGFAALAWVDGEWIGGALLLLGGAICVVELGRRGPKEWGLMPPGSTPRLILVVVGGILSLWVAVSVASGPDAGLRFASLAVLGLSAARLLQGTRPVPVLAASAGLAIALAGASALVGTDAGFAPYLIGAAIAAGVAFLPVAEPRGA